MKLNTFESETLYSFKFIKSIGCIGMHRAERGKRGGIVVDGDGKLVDLGHLMGIGCNVANDRKGYTAFFGMSNRSGNRTVGNGTKTAGRRELSERLGTRVRFIGEDGAELVEALLSDEQEG